MMDFIKELTESRLLHSGTDIQFSYGDTCENLYLAILAVEFISHCKETKSVAENYTRKTTMYSPYNEFRANATDLHNLIYFVSTDASRVESIYKSSDAKAQRERTHLPVMALNGYLTSLGKPGNRDIYFLMRVEQALAIKNSNSKEIRRILSYHNPTSSDVQQLSSRILNEFRNRMPLFDLLPELDQKLHKGLTFDQ